MFTGIIQTIGILDFIDRDSNKYTILTDLNLNDCETGSSICCDGVCLTMIDIKNLENKFKFDVNIGEETLKRSNLNNWNKNCQINLEKSLRLGDEISGHFVYGHVDALTTIKSINKIDNSWEFYFSLSALDNKPNLKKMIVEKGSIAINGISLTIANVNENFFSVSIIPHTFNNTNLSKLKINDSVNIEFDPLARYISKHYEK